MVTTQSPECEPVRARAASQTPRRERRRDRDQANNQVGSGGAERDGLII